MPRPSIDYLNARRAALPASGGARQSRAVKYAPDRELDPLERLELELESSLADCRIRTELMRQQKEENANY